MYKTIFLTKENYLQENSCEDFYIEIVPAYLAVVNEVVMTPAGTYVADECAYYRSFTQYLISIEMAIWRKVQEMGLLLRCNGQTSSNGRLLTMAELACRCHKIGSPLRMLPPVKI